MQRERRNQVEPRCAERWHLRDDEQFDLAAWFLLPKGKECGVAILHSNTVNLELFLSLHYSRPLSRDSKSRKSKIYEELLKVMRF